MTNNLVDTIMELKNSIYLQEPPASIAAHVNDPDVDKYLENQMFHRIVVNYLVSAFQNERYDRDEVDRIIKICETEDGVRRVAAHVIINLDIPFDGIAEMEVLEEKMQ